MDLIKLWSEIKAAGNSINGRDALLEKYAKGNYREKELFLFVDNQYKIVENKLNDDEVPTAIDEIHIFLTELIIKRGKELAYDILPIIYDYYMTDTCNEEGNLITDFLFSFSAEELNYNHALQNAFLKACRVNDLNWALNLLLIVSHSASPEPDAYQKNIRTVFKGEDAEEILEILNDDSDDSDNYAKEDLFMKKFAQTHHFE